MSDSSTTEGIQGIQVSAAATSWNGSPTTIKVDDKITMQQTPNGTLILAAINKSTLNNAGEITTSSGAGPSLNPTLDFGASAPWVNSYNWRGNNLSITNTSVHADTPIQVQGIGPGIPGGAPVKPLPQNTPVALNFGDLAQGGTNPQQMQLKIQNNDSTTAVVGIIGGPADASGSNAKVIAVNFPSDQEKPEGYYAVTPDNAYTLKFNWNGASIFVGNLSSSATPQFTVTLRAI